MTSHKQYIVDNLLNANIGNLYNSKSKMWQKHCISNKHMHNHITTKWNHIPNIQICIHNFYHISENNKKISSWLKWTSSNYPNFFFVKHVYCIYYPCQLVRNLTFHKEYNMKNLKWKLEEWMHFWIKNEINISWAILWIVNFFVGRF